MKFKITLFFLLASLIAMAQPFKVDNNNIDFRGNAIMRKGFIAGDSGQVASAIAEFRSTTKGVLLPRMTTSQMLSISSPASGLTVFNTDSGKFYYFFSSTWIQINPAGASGTGEVVRLHPTGVAYAISDSTLYADSNFTKTDTSFYLGVNLGGGVKAEIKTQKMLGLVPTLSFGITNGLSFSGGISYNATEVEGDTFSVVVSSKPGDITSAAGSAVNLHRYSGFEITTQDVTENYGAFVGGNNSTQFQAGAIGIEGNTALIIDTSTVRVTSYGDKQGWIIDLNSQFAPQHVLTNIYTDGGGTPTLGWSWFNNNAKLEGWSESDSVCNNATGAAESVGYKYNTVFGRGAPKYGESASGENTFIGSEAAANWLSDNNQLETWNNGRQNVFVGAFAASETDTSSGCIAIGASTGIPDGGYNIIAIGREAAPTENYSICIGAGAISHGENSLSFGGGAAYTKIDKLYINDLTYNLPSVHNENGALTEIDGSGTLAWVKTWVKDTGSNSLYSTDFNVGIGPSNIQNKKFIVSTDDYPDGVFSVDTTGCNITIGDISDFANTTKINVNDVDGIVDITTPNGTSIYGGANIYHPFKFIEDDPTTVGYILTAKATDGEVEWTEPITRKLKITVDSAQIANMGTSPVELVAAPGAGKYIDVISITSFYNHNTSAWVLGGARVVAAYEDYFFTGTPIFSSLANTVITPTTRTGYVFTRNSTYSDFENSAVQLTTDDNTDPINGDGSLIIFITYTINDL